jgi:hypothetical protein
VFGYWLLAIGCWQLFSSGFVPAAGRRVRMKIGGRRKSEVRSKLIFIRFCAGDGMRVSMKNHFGCWLLAIGCWHCSFLFVPERSRAWMLA